ncbi:MAG: hypothetical protein LBI91_04765 [Spirochaetaceae bacterium]|jgi:hypothetical protein|nr:hypothetical protein [Spirochaetaceae bacterium]
MKRGKARKSVCFFFFAFFSLMPSVNTAGAQDRWYISNAAGMALEPAFPRLAMRGKYALAVTEILPGDLPGNLREFYDSIYREARLKAEAEAETGEGAAAAIPFSLRLEKRILYENRQASRQQWLFLDRENQIRLAAAFALDPAEYPPPETGDAGGASQDSAEPNAGPGPAGGESLPAAGDTGETGDAGEGEGSPGGEDGEEAEGEKSSVDYSGYIELYNPEGYIVEEHLFSSDSTDRIVNYFYNKRILVRAVTKIQHPANGEEETYTENYCTDYYRYSRSSSLRGVERIYHTQAENEPVQMRFPHVVLGAAKNALFVNPGFSFTNEFFKDILLDSGSRVLYTTDDRGRVLTETRRDEEGEVTGELRNTWSGDRLVSVHWKAGDDERVTEFEYDDDGDRILERNINRGVLERVVTMEGENEIELLYMDGKPMLRAVWENGRKISEERIRPSAASGAGAGF